MEMKIDFDFDEVRESVFENRNPENVTQKELIQAVLDVVSNVTIDVNKFKENRDTGAETLGDEFNLYMFSDNIRGGAQMVASASEQKEMIDNYEE